MKLIKCSAPGWEKEFDTEEELVAELQNYVCHGCMVGYDMIVGDDGELEEVPTEPIDINSVDELLSTPCGCEFLVSGVGYDKD